MKNNISIIIKNANYNIKKISLAKIKIYDFFKTKKFGSKLPIKFKFGVFATNIEQCESKSKKRKAVLKKDKPVYL